MTQLGSGSGEHSVEDLSSVVLQECTLATAVLLEVFITAGDPILLI